MESVEAAFNRRPEIAKPSRDLNSPPRGTSKQLEHLRSLEQALIRDVNVQLSSDLQIALNAIIVPLGGKCVDRVLSKKASLSFTGYFHLPRKNCNRKRGSIKRK